MGVIRIVGAGADITRPTVTINQSSVDPSSDTSIPFAVIFSKPVTGFTSSDVTLAATVGGTLVTTVTGAGSVYTVTVTGMTTAGTVTASIPANIAQDVAGNLNDASTSTDNTVAWSPPATTTVVVTTIGADTVRILIPSSYNAAVGANYVEVHHGAGGGNTIIVDPIVAPTVQKWLDAGWIVAATDAAGDNWGNAAGVAAYVAMETYVRSHYTILNTLIWGGSMGGLTGYQRASSGTVTNLKGVCMLYPVCDLAHQFGSNAGWAAPAIRTAYGIASDGSDYASKTSGHDPMLIAEASYPNILYRFYHSPGDTFVTKTENSDAMATKLASRVEHVVVTTSGEHGDASNLQPDDQYDFFVRCLAYTAGVLTAADITYVGSYRAPTSGTASEVATGYGLYLRRETSDTTNPVHLGTSGTLLSQIWTAGGRVKLEMRGTSIKLYVDEGSGYGVPVCSVVDSDITAAGKAGLFTGIDSAYYLNNFTATTSAASVFVNDTLNDADGTLLSAHTGGTGATWTKHPSHSATALITSNILASVGGGADNATYYASGSPATADYDVEADFIYGGLGAVGVCGRMSTSADTMYFGYYNATTYTPGQGHNWVIGKNVNGAYTNLAVAPSPKNAIGVMAEIWEWRDATPTNPGSNKTLSSSYGAATRVRNWGNAAAGPAPSKRSTTISGGGGGPVYQDPANGGAGTNPWGGLGWDPVNQVLFWTVIDTYVNAIDCSFGYTELNYATGVPTVHGPYKLAVTKSKGGLAGFTPLPAGFVSAAGLGTQTMASFGTPFVSVIAAEDVSCGPQLNAFVPPIGVAEGTNTIASTKLVGYSPWSSAPAAGTDRAVRPVSLPLYEGPNGKVYAPTSSWPFTNWEAGANDFTYAGAFIHGPLKSGFVSLAKLSKGVYNYCNASIYSEMSIPALSIVSEADLIDVKNGVKQPHEIQPVTTEFTFPVMDPADYASVVLGPITSITAVAGDLPQYTPELGIDTGAIVTMASPHGWAVGQGPGYGGIFAVRGNSNFQYNGVCGFYAIDTTRFRIWNNSLASSGGAHMTYNGVTGTGGEVFYVGFGDHRGVGIRILGLAYDEITKQLYLGFVHKDGTPMVSVFAVNC